MFKSEEEKVAYCNEIAVILIEHMNALYILINTILILVYLMTNSKTT